MAESGLTPRHKILIFGGGGAIGTAISEGALDRGWDVVVTTRKSAKSDAKAITSRVEPKRIVVDPDQEELTSSVLASTAPYSAVCWAQGANLNDNIFSVDIARHLDLYKANCTFILSTLGTLLKENLLSRPARLCVISSIWQKLARQNKLSYCMTKAALQGFVLSASTDLAAEGHLLNAILPGALDTPMTRANLTEDQIEKLSSSTRFNRLPAPRDVVSLALYLCSTANTGVTGQFIATDLGFSNVHLL